MEIGERALFFIVGEEALDNLRNSRMLTKPYKNKRELDYFIIYNFSGSKEVRTHYIEEINTFLNKLVSPNEKNSVVILEKQKNGYRRIKVLYSSSFDILKKALSNFAFLDYVIDKDITPENRLRLLSEVEANELFHFFHHNESKEIPEEIQQILKSLEESLLEDFERLRKLLKYYKEWQAIQEQEKGYQMKIGTL